MPHVVYSEGSSICGQVQTFIKMLLLVYVSSPLQTKTRAPPPHWALRVYLTHSLKVKFLVSPYTVGCRISPTIIVSLSLFSNSIPFLCKEHFSSSKTDKVRAFYRKSLKYFKRNRSKYKKINSSTIFGQYLSHSLIESNKHILFPSIPPHQGMAWQGISSRLRFHWT